MRRNPECDVHVPVDVQNARALEELLQRRSTQPAEVVPQARIKATPPSEASRDEKKEDTTSK